MDEYIFEGDELLFDVGLPVIQLTPELRAEMKRLGLTWRVVRGFVFVDRRVRSLPVRTSHPDLRKILSFEYEDAVWEFLKNEDLTRGHGSSKIE